MFEPQSNLNLRGAGGVGGWPPTVALFVLTAWNQPK